MCDVLRDLNIAGFKLQTLGAKLFASEVRSDFVCLCCRIPFCFSMSYAPVNEHSNGKWTRIEDVIAEGDSSYLILIRTPLYLTHVCVSLFTIKNMVGGLSG